MKKKYLKPKKEKKFQVGAYDLKGKWWFKEDIETFTGGMIQICFNKNREDIEIISREIE